MIRSTVATGRRRWRLIHSITTPFITDARSFGKRRTAEQSWSVISPDLSTKDPSRLFLRVELLATTWGNSMARWFSRLRHRRSRRDSFGRERMTDRSGTRRMAAATGTNVSKNISGMPAWGTIACIEPSHFDAGTAYVAVDFHLMDDRDPYIYKTTDFGADLDANQQRFAHEASARLCEEHCRGSEQAKVCFSRERGMVFITRRMMAGTGHLCRRACRMRQCLGSWCRRISRCSGLHIWPRFLHS